MEPSWVTELAYNYVNLKGHDQKGVVCFEGQLFIKKLVMVPLSLTVQSMYQL